MPRQERSPKWGDTPTAWQIRTFPDLRFRNALTDDRFDVGKSAEDLWEVTVLFRPSVHVTRHNQL